VLRRVVSSTGESLELRQQLRDIGTILPGAMGTDPGDELASLLGGHVAVASVITEQSRRRDNWWALEGVMHERVIR